MKWKILIQMNRVDKVTYITLSVVSLFMTPIQGALHHFLIHRHRSSWGWGDWATNTTREGIVKRLTIDAIPKRFTVTLVFTWKNISSIR